MTFQRSAPRHSTAPVVKTVNVVHSKASCTFFLFVAAVLLLANAAIPGLHAGNLYPNCTITAIDTSSGIVTSRETTTGKTFYFQVADPAQLQHLGSSQVCRRMAWLHQTTPDRYQSKCPVESSTNVTGSNSRVPVNTGPANPASTPSAPEFCCVPISEPAKAR